MNILIADKFPPRWTDVLTQQGHRITYAPALDEKTLPTALVGQEILIVRSTKVPACVIETAHDLKLVIRAGAGTNTIDTACAAQKGVAVCNCPGTNSVAVAELTMGLVLALDRRIVHNTLDLRQGVWNKNEYGKAKGLFGRTIGIIGLGAIGQEVAKRARAFGMNILGYAPNGRAEKVQTLGITPIENLYELAAQADVITIHLPENAETKGLFDQKFFDAMKPGAIFVNAARGGLVVTSALCQAIQNKGIKAGLDVYENEPKATDKAFDYSPYIGAENFYGTHHIGASTEQAQDAVAECVVKIVKEYATNGRFLHRVN
ncbi:MAG: phosphoglycerate dehydrogenase [Elusimicrobiaceae bacterium]|nr:phosphoglycerate dehydrogenase [Elusimicrobiaceae bacterium]